MKIPAADAIHLLHEAPHAVLATHSQQSPGYPYATAVPLVTNGHQEPLLFVSALAEHTRNLLADGRVSLAVTAAGHANVQNAPRLTLLGTCERIEPSPALLARYLRYQPEAEQYLGLDFGFFRVAPQRLRFIGGIGRMGWLESSDWATLPCLDERDERALLERLAQDVPASVQVLGVDAFGIDCRVGERMVRRRFDAPLTAESIAASAAGLLAGLC